MSQRDIDAEFERLVAPLRTKGEDPAAKQDLPAAPDLSGIAVWRGSIGPSSDEVYLTPVDDDEDFTPAPVDLPGTDDVHYWGALACLVAGPLLMIWVTVSQPAYRLLWFVVGLGIAVAGFALMVSRSGPSPDDPDRGARV